VEAGEQGGEVGVGGPPLAIQQLTREAVEGAQATGQVQLALAQGGVGAGQEAGAGASQGVEEDAGAGRLDVGDGGVQVGGVASAGEEHPSNKEMVGQQDRAFFSG